MSDCFFFDDLNDRKLFGVIAGPCVIESKKHSLRMAAALREKTLLIDTGTISQRIPFLFKSSFDKANRTSVDGYRGIGFDEAYYIFQEIHGLGIETTTDVHDVWQAASTNVDIIQIPAFLCRQTDLLQAAAESERVVNVKKGQFMSPEEMTNVVEKLRRFGCERIMVTERGTTFGYNNLVVDMRSLVTMRKMGVPLVFDATHSTQSPGGLGNASGGSREMAEVLGRAACGVGIDAVFMEVHDDPDNAPSDGPSQIKLDRFESVLTACHRLTTCFRENQ